MPNYDGIYELRIFYSTTPSGQTQMTHRLTFDIKLVADVAVGTAFADIDVLPRNLTPVTLDSWLMDPGGFMELLVDCYPGAAEFPYAELWKIPEGTFDATFISAYEIGLVGTSVTASTSCQQTTFTFRSIGGGVARLQLMESSFTGNTRQTPPFSTVANALSTFFASAASCALARDNSYVFARIAQNDGQNETLFKKRFRNV